MQLIEYKNLNSLNQDILPVIEDNFISHYLLFEAVDRLFKGDEKTYYACTVQVNNIIEIIYLHTSNGHYFFGTTENNLAIDYLSERLSIEKIAKDSFLFGNTFIIDHFIKKKRLNFKNIKHRYYMSLTSCSYIKKNNEVMLHPAQEKDFDLLVPLKLKFYKEEFEGEGLQSEEDVLAKFKIELQSEGTYYWKENNQITTLISITKLPENRIFIPNIYTLPEFRNKGISKSALGTLLINLFNLESIEIGLNVKVSNKSAIGLFSSLGMKKIYETGIYEYKEISSR